MLATSVISEAFVAACLAAVFGVLLTVATPTLPRWGKIWSWVMYAGVCYGFAVYWVGEYADMRYQKILAMPGVVVILGGIWGAVAGAVALRVFPPDGNGPTPTPTPPQAQVDKEDQPAVSTIDPSVECLVIGQLADDLNVDGERVSNAAAITFFVRLVNAGPPTIARDWKLNATIKGKNVTGRMLPEARGRQFHVNEGWGLRLNSGQEIQELAGKNPIPTGGSVMGVIEFAFPGFSHEELKSEPIENFRLSFHDAYGKEHSVIMDDPKVGKMPSPIPGFDLELIPPKPDPSTISVQLAEPPTGKPTYDIKGYVCGEPPGMFLVLPDKSGSEIPGVFALYSVKLPNQFQLHLQVYGENSARVFTVMPDQPFWIDVRIGKETYLIEVAGVKNDGINVRRYKKRAD